jgi:hypothetical protein
MRMARVVFAIAGLWGIAVLLPLYFRYEALGREAPPPT